MHSTVFLNIIICNITTTLFCSDLFKCPQYKNNNDNKNKNSEADEQDWQHMLEQLLQRHNILYTKTLLCKVTVAYWNRRSSDSRPTGNGGYRANSRLIGNKR